MDEDTRFRRALKNPIVMVSLCLLAGIAMYDNIIKPALESSLPESVASLLSPTAPTPIPSTSSLVEHDEIATQWIDHPARDPFGPITVGKKSNSSSKQSMGSAMRHESSVKKLILKAIAIETQQRSAVINRQVVYEGEMIEGYQVVSIQLKGVWLKRHGKKELLTFATKTSS